MVEQNESSAQRRSRAHLKELLLEAGTEVLARDGLGFTTDTITYKRVFEHLEQTQGIRITRGSVHERIWDRQRDFQLEILQRSLNWAPEATDDDMIAAAVAVLEAADLTTEDGRWRAARDLVRNAAAAVYATSDSDDQWSQWIGVTLAMAGPGTQDIPESRAMLDKARESYNRRTDELTATYATFLSSARMQIRRDMFADPDVGLRTMTRLLTAVADGLALREQFDPDAANEIEVSDGADGVDRWHPFSLGGWAVVRFFLEPIPDD